jgi:hypothetical protein
MIRYCLRVSQLGSWPQLQVMQHSRDAVKCIEKFVLLCVCLSAYFLLSFLGQDSLGISPQQNGCSSSSEMSVCTYGIRHCCSQIMLLARFLTWVTGRRMDIVLVARECGFLSGI